MITKNIDTGLSTISRYWTNDDANVLQLAYELQDAECGVLHENKLGQIAFESRAHRPAHTAVYTFGTGGLYMWNLRQEDPLRGVYNEIDAQRRTFNVSEDTLLAVIADVRNNQGGTPPTIPNGSTTISIRFPGPGTPSNYIAVSSWGIIDVEVNSAVDGTGTDITNSNVTLSRTEYADRIDVTFTSDYGSNAYAVLLRAHGTAVVEGDPIPISSSDGTSIANYRKRIYPNVSHWLTDSTEAKDYCDHIIALYKDPHARITFEVKANYSAAHLAAVAAIDVSDKIHIHATVAKYGLGIDGDFFVEYIRHRVDSGRVHVVEYQCRAAATHSWLASGTPYTPKEVPDGVPDDLYTAAIDPAMHILCGAGAWKYNRNITGARFRARYYEAPLGADEGADLRTKAEGGVMEHDGETMIVVDSVIADENGAQYEWDSIFEGCWYYAFQFISAAGYSVWSDGNKTPQFVKDYVATDPEGAATGPPADWWIEVEPDPSGNHAVIVKASRPKTNGHKIWRWVAQIKDSSSFNDFDGLDADAGVANGPKIDYGFYGDANNPPEDSNVLTGTGDDGWIQHNVSQDNRRFTRTYGQEIKGGITYPSAVTEHPDVGWLICVDRRGGVFDIDYCQWGTVKTIQGLYSGYDVETATYFDVAGRFHLDAQTDIRLTIVCPPWNWSTRGYFGAEENHGLFEEVFWDPPNHGDTTTEIFVSDPIDVPTNVALSDIKARVWFDNGYSVSDGGIVGTLTSDQGNPSGATGLTILTNADDPAIPAGSIAFRWNRETANYKDIYVVAAWLSSALPAEGPYAAERTGHPDCVIETGTCVSYKGDKKLTISPARTPDASVIGRALLMFTNDASPDSDLDGNVIVAEDANSITLSAPFRRSGTFSYAIVKAWWNVPTDTANLAYYQWTVEQVTPDVELPIWRTPPVPLPNGSYYVTLANRNDYGLGTRLVPGGTGSPDPPTEVHPQGCTDLTVSGGEVDTDADLGSVFCISSADAFTLNNPTGTLYCGQTLLWMIDGAGVPTLDTKFRLMDGETISKSSGRDLLGAIYNSDDDQWDAMWKKGT